MVKNYVKKGFRIAAPIVGISAVTLYPILFLYGQNIGEISFVDVLQPLKLFLLFTGIILFIYLVFGRNFEQAIFNTAAIMFFVMNFRMIEKAGRKILPSIRYWHILTVLVVLFVLLIRFSFLEKEFLRQIIMVVSLVFWGLILLNILPKVPEMVSQIVSTEDADYTTGSVNKTSKMNIYYLIFDEYSNVDFMKKYYDYDNSGLIADLEELGFNVSRTSSNEAYITEVCMTNIMNMDYLYDQKASQVKETQQEMSEKRIHNKVFEILRNEGYNIRGMGISDFYGLPKAEGGSKSEKTTITGKSVMDIVIEKTAFYPFFQHDFADKLDSINRSVRYLLDVKKEPNTSQFTLFHIESSHTPFVMDENGDQIPGKFAQEWKDKQYYRNTYIYTTKIIQQLVNSILQEDPQSVIVVSSDHSARAAQSGYDNMFEEKDKCKTFNAVYFAGEPLEIEGLSGINTMRLIMNQLFQTDYEMIDTYPFMAIEEYEKDE